MKQLNLFASFKNIYSSMSCSKLLENVTSIFASICILPCITVSFLALARTNAESL